MLICVISGLQLAANNGQQRSAAGVYNLAGAE
jgi:hypothetical protein